MPKLTKSQDDRPIIMPLFNSKFPQPRVDRLELKDLLLNEVRDKFLGETDRRLERIAIAIEKVASALANPRWRGILQGHPGRGGVFHDSRIAEDYDVAFVPDDRTGGTEDTIKKAEKLGKKVMILHA